MKYRAPLLALLASVLLGVGWWYLLYEPKLEEQEAYEIETAELEAEEARLRSEIAELERVRDNEMAIRSELALMEEYIPNGVAQPSALRDLQDAADAAGVEIASLTFGAPVAIEDSPDTGDPETTLADVSVSMTVEGGYFQLVDLLRRLEVEVARALLIESVSMDEGGEDGFPTLQTEWSGRVFAVVDVGSTVDPEEADPEEVDGEDDAEEDDSDEDSDEDDADEDDLDLDDEGAI